MKQQTVTLRLRGAAWASAFAAISGAILISPKAAQAQGQSPTTQPQPGYMFDMSGMGKSFGEMLKGYGIYLNGGAYQNYFGYFGGRKQGSAGQGEYTLGADLDLNQMFGISGAAIHISTDERSGVTPTRYTGSGILSTANYGPTDGYRLGELSWDQTLLNDHVRILVGHIADNIDFDTSELYCQFLLVTCGNTNAWYFNNSNPSYPVANWGGRVTIKPTQITYLRFGAYQETTIQGASNHLGWPGASWDFGHNSGVFIPIELGYKTNGDQDPLPRAFDIGGYYDSARYTDPFGFKQQGRSAVYIQGQQMLFRPDPKADRGLTVFGSALLDTSNAGPIAQQFVGGFWWKGPLPFRPADSLGFSANYWEWNRSWAQAFQAANGAALRRSEWLLELNYGYELAPGVEFKPMVAYVINPDLEFGLVTPTQRHASNAWIVGAQLSVGFNNAFGLPAFARTN